MPLKTATVRDMLRQQRATRIAAASQKKTTTPATGTRS